MEKTVCIIGAGVAGLAGIKQSLDEGLTPICFEKDSDLGGIWKYRDVPLPGYPSLYKSCFINTSKAMTCYSDFPIPKDFPNFMHHKFFKKYLQLYAENFGLRNYINFAHRVERVSKADDFQESGDWIVTVINVKTGSIETKRVNFVLVANGHLYQPNIPKFPGLDRFQGKVLHTHDYKDFKAFEKKNILVVGVGNSACDIACELSHHAEHVYISTRNGTYVVQRTSHQGRPLDQVAVTRFSQSLPQKYLRPLQFKKVNNRYDMAKYGLAPNGPFRLTAIAISDELPDRIMLGTITVKTDVEYLTENDVIFTDGTTVKNIDAIVFGTGYVHDFPFLQERLIRIENQFPYLYNHIWPVSLEPPTLAVVGLLHPFGALPAILEMQTRWAMRVFAGHCKLPPVPKRHQEVEQRLAIIKASPDLSPRHFIVVNAIGYMDKLANLIGCKPKLLTYFFTDNALWRKLVFGPCTPPQWRLCGPGKWTGARGAIESVEENLWYPLKTRSPGVNRTVGLYDEWLSLLSKVAIIFLVLKIIKFCVSNKIFVRNSN